jgi:hypothetical protein
MHLSEEGREELDSAALATSTAYSVVRGGSGGGGGVVSHDEGSGGSLLPLAPGLEDILAEKVQTAKILLLPSKCDITFVTLSKW